MRTALAVLTAAALLPAAAGSHAADDAIEEAINARHGYYMLLGANIGPLAAMAKGEIDYDADTALRHARNLAQLGAYDALFHFPHGSAKPDRPGKTRALPAIWSDEAGFAAKMGDFAEAAALMPEAAGTDRAGLAQAVGRLGATCKACHDDYRAKDF